MNNSLKPLEDFIFLICFPSTHSSIVLPCIKWQIQLKSLGNQMIEELGDTISCETIGAVCMGDTVWLQDFCSETAF